MAAAVNGDVIVFDAAISAIALTNGEIATPAVSIIGPGASALTITTDADPDAYDMFRVGGTGDAVISGLTITKNRIKALNDGKFTLDGVTVSGSTSGYGGALYAGNDGVLEIIDSNFENNTATTDGGAIYIYNYDDATISGSTFTDNESLNDGGAIYGNGVENVTIIDCTITGNSAGDDGGGLSFLQSSAVLSITGTTIDANDAGNNGGGLNVEADGPLIVNIANSTVSNNTAEASAGILFNDPDITATINNSTISANAALYGGGGVYINPGSSLTINQSTISANSAPGTSPETGGGGIALGDNTSVVTISGSIVSGNSAGLVGTADFGLYSTLPSYTGSITATNSIIGEVDSRITVNGTNNVTTTNPMLGALANNGGPTKTMALLTGSPAIDAGPNPVATFTGNQFDQRGAGYARVVGGVVDIGAFEVQPGPAPSPDTPVVPAFTG